MVLPPRRGRHGRPDDLAALGGVAAALVMDLGDERAGGIDHRQVALGGQLLDALGHAVGGEDRAGPRRDLVEFVHEDRAASPQVFHHVPVVHNFVTHIDRGPYFFSARSTISIARSTPAQKPRGCARTTRIMPLVLLQDACAMARRHDRPVESDMTCRPASATAVQQTYRPGWHRGVTSAKRTIRSRSRRRLLWQLRKQGTAGMSYKIGEPAPYYPLGNRPTRYSPSIGLAGKAIRASSRG